MSDWHNDGSTASGERSFPRRLLAALAILVLALAALVVIPAAAYAEPNPDIVVRDVTVTSVDGGQATVGDTLTVAGAWDATAADPHEGDTFTIGLPPELGFGAAIPFSLIGPDPDGVDTTWATCLTDPATGVATCELTSAVEQYPELVQGEFQFDVTAVGATAEEEVVFSLNGEEVSVDLPGEGGIDDGIVVPDEWDKRGALNANKWSVGWTIELPGARMAGHDVIVIAETLSDNHRLCEPSTLRVETVRGTTIVDVTGIATVQPGADPQHFRIELAAPEGGFDPTVTYRVAYDTCTPDGEIDPEGTEYTNEAEIDVWGESSGVIGVAQDWTISDTIGKQGSVLGGAERNGTISWTVTVPGDHLFGKESFTLSESLAGEHEVCADTIGGIQILERYGPSNELRQNVTGSLTAAVVATSSQAFTVEFAIAEGSDFAFLANDHMYQLVYSTCATTDGLPESGTVFGNEASVDGLVDGGTATVPGRTDQKRGSINTSSVTIDGVEHLPQTTIDWVITVPGQHITDVDSALTVTDELSATQEVCVGTGGSVASRLDLRVEARDQIQGGGLATVDLSDSASATVGDDGIAITIPQPTLPVPGGGEETGFSREYQYVIVYTTCTVSGGMDAPGTVYGNAAVVNGRSYTHATTQSNSGAGTGQGVPRGSVSISKQLADTAGAGLVPSDAVFTVHVREIDPSGTTQIEYDLEVALDGEPVSSPNTRGTGWTIELSEPAFPDVPGIVFGDPVFSASPGVTVSDDGTVATAALTPGANIAVTLTNEARLGSVEIVKEVDGGAAQLVDADQTYRITAEIDTSGLGDGVPAQPDRTFDVRQGEPHLVEGLPIGSVVTFTEQVPADDDALTWGEPTIEPGSIEVLPGHAAEPATIAVTNQVERTVGTFSLAKLVTGAEAENPAVPSTVTVDAVWDEEGESGSRTLTLPTDGTPVPLGESLLIGTEVTLTEAVPADGSGIAWGAPVWSGTGVTIDGDTAVVTVSRSPDATVTVENHAATSTAGISLLKGIAGEAAADVEPWTEFPVTVTWTDGDGAPQSRALTITAAEPTPLGEELPAGTVVTITEGQRPGIDTVVWGPVAISGEGVDDAGDGSATVVVSDQQGQVTLVTVVNEATWAPGSLAIAKGVDGILLDHPDVPAAVTVVATWSGDDGVERSTELTLPTDGTRVALGEDLPHGTEVVLTELAPASTPGFTWADPAWSGDDLEVRDDGSVVVVVAAARVAEISLVNEAVPSLGDLLLTKTLAGGGAAAIPADTVFPVSVSWTGLLGEPHRIDIAVTAGETAIVTGVPLGTRIQVEEGAADVPGDARWTSAQWAAEGDGVLVETEDGSPLATVTIVGGEGVGAALALENAYAGVAGLATTGGAVSLLVSSVAFALLVGAGLLLLARRRRLVR